MTARWLLGFLLLRSLVPTLEHTNGAKFNCKRTYPPSSLVYRKLSRTGLERVMIGDHRRFSCLQMPLVDRHGSHCAVFGSLSTLRASRRPRPFTQARHQAKTCTACDQLLHDLHVVVVLVRRGARDRHSRWPTVSKTSKIQHTYGPSS